jgi:hypothetical protein
VRSEGWAFFDLLALDRGEAGREAGRHLSLGKKNNNDQDLKQFYRSPA